MHTGFLSKKEKQFLKESQVNTPEEVNVGYRYILMTCDKDDVLSMEQIQVSSVNDEDSFDAGDHTYYWVGYIKEYGISKMPGHWGGYNRLFVYSEKAEKILSKLHDNQNSIGWLIFLEVCDLRTAQASH